MATKPQSGVSTESGRSDGAAARTNDGGESAGSGNQQQLPIDDGSALSDTLTSIELTMKHHLEALIARKKELTDSAAQAAATASTAEAARALSARATTARRSARRASQMMIDEEKAVEPPPVPSRTDKVSGNAL
jgi:hypothetical protein